MVNLGRLMQVEHGDNNGSRRPRAFQRFDTKRDAATGGWTPVDLGGHEVMARLHLQLPAGPDAARRARSRLDQLDGHIQDSVLEVVRLLVTELVTNSVRHGSAHEPVDIEVDLFANSIRVEVTDSGPGFELEHPPRPHEDRPGGWGLCLIDRLADRWGVERRGGTCVWFEVERTGDRWRVAA